MEREKCLATTKIFANEMRKYLENPKTMSSGYYARISSDVEMVDDFEEKEYTLSLFKDNNLIVEYGINDEKDGRTSYFGFPREDGLLATYYDGDKEFDEIKDVIENEKHGLYETLVSKVLS